MRSAHSFTDVQRFLSGRLDVGNAVMYMVSTYTASTTASHAMNAMTATEDRQIQATDINCLSGKGKIGNLSDLSGFSQGG
jgi:hypothetical protein